MNRTLLVIDDDPIIRRLFFLYLQKKGFMVLLAESAEEGLEYLNNHPVDLITCDVIMPGMNGIEFLKKIKNGSTFENIPVVVLSATGSQYEPTFFSGFKMTRVLTKPCLPQDLEVVIHQMLGD